MWCCPSPSHEGRHNFFGGDMEEVYENQVKNGRRMLLFLGFNSRMYDDIVRMTNHYEVCRFELAMKRKIRTQKEIQDAFNN
jgi:hypothetical protein